MIRFENQNKTEKKIQNEYRFNSFAFITRSLNTTTIFGLEFFLSGVTVFVPVFCILYFMSRVRGGAHIPNEKRSHLSSFAY